jgi:hypothetical protein
LFDLDRQLIVVGVVAPMQIACLDEQFLGAFECILGFLHLGEHVDLDHFSFIFLCTS